MEMLYVQMLGGLSISTETKQITDRDNRSRKIWVLLAYLIYHRHRIVLQDELINLLWNEDEQGANPVGALKTMFHRARTMLDKLGPSAGHDLILNQNGGYMWNGAVDMKVDIDEFDRLCRKSTGDDAELIESDFKAMQLYKGDFLQNMSSESWIIPIAAYYHNCYMQTLLRVLPIMLGREQYNEAAEICHVASNVEPYSEEIHYFYLKALLNMGDQKGAANVYKQFNERLYTNFGVLPNEEIRALYYEANKTDNRRIMTIEVIKEQLRESNSPAGALICEYDFFRILYRATARSLARSGMAAHIALLTIDGDLSKRKLEGAMDMLEEQIRCSLRRGDTAARCSVSQFVVMLPQANYEDSCMVCERIVKGYYRKHPHSDANVQYAAYPLEPDEGSFPVNK